MDEEVLATLEDMLFREQVLCEGKKVDALKAAITALSAPPEPKAEPGTGATHNHGDPMIDGWKAYATSSAHPPAPPEGWKMPPDEWVRDYTKKHCTVRTGDHWRAEAWNLKCAFRAWAKAAAPPAPETSE